MQLLRFALVLVLATPIAADEDFRAAEPSTDFLAAVPATILTDSNWTEFVTQDDVPTFVMFHAPWCGHCRNLTPTWEKLSAKLAEESPPAARIAKYDATANSGMPVRLFFLDSFPTLIVFANQGGGHRAHRYSGARQLAVLEEFARGGYKKAKAEYYLPFWIGSFVSWWMQIMQPLQDLLELRCFGRRASTGQCVGACGAIFVGALAVAIIIIWIINFINWLLTRVDETYQGARAAGEREKAD